MVRVAPAEVSRGPVPALAGDYPDLVAVREQAAGFPARAAVVWAKAVQRAGQGLASQAKAIARMSIVRVHFLQGRVGKVRSLA